LCVRQASEPRDEDPASQAKFGYSGLDITILDYGLSRAEDLESGTECPIAYDLEKDLSIFTSTHAKQCKVYRRMRTFLLTGDRGELPPSEHRIPYEDGISWSLYYSYTNVLWLAYLFDYMVASFQGDKKKLSHFKRTTKEFWSHMNPDAPPETLSFSSASDVVRFAVEAGWLTEAQLSGHGESRNGLETPDESCNESIIEAQVVERAASELRRSPRKRHPRVL
jgi:serine/threonine-protein kinase haspin